MKAILLAGGSGTRLRPLTFAIPKPLVPVGEQPILELLLRHLVRHGCTDAYLAVGYKAFLIETYFADASEIGLEVHFLHEREPLGTAGPLRAVRDHFGLSEPVFASNADIVTNANLTAMYALHREAGADITIGVRTHTERLIYGAVEHDGPRVTRITEKPEISMDVSGGMYVLQPAILDLVPIGPRMDMPDLINAAIGQGARVVCHQLDGYWIGVESLAELEQARELLLERVPGTPNP